MGRAYLPFIYEGSEVQKVVSTSSHETMGSTELSTISSKELFYSSVYSPPQDLAKPVLNMDPGLFNP